VAKVEVFLVDLEELEDLAEAEAKVVDLEDLVTKEVSLHPKEITGVQTLVVKLPEAAVEQTNQVQIIVVKMVDQVVMVLLG
jgi:hypothetical protein